MIKSDDKNIEDLKVRGKVGRLKWTSIKHSLNVWHVGHGFLCQVLLLLLLQKKKKYYYYCYIRDFEEICTKISIKI